MLSTSWRNVGSSRLRGCGRSTLISAEKTGRRARLIELEPRYCDVTIERFRLAFGGEPTERKTGLAFAELAALRTQAAAMEAGNVE